MKQSIFTLTIFLSLISFPSLGQRGLNDLDTKHWVKIDTVEFRSDFVFLVFYKDSTIQKIRVDKFANTSWTQYFFLENNQLLEATFEYYDPVGYRPPNNYYFSNGKMTSWTDLLGNEQANRESQSFKNEETLILAMFNEYFEKAIIHNSTIR